MFDKCGVFEPGFSEDLILYGFGPDLSELSESEIIRIRKEVEIIRRRGWQDYILWLASFIKKLHDSNSLSFLSKSAKDSYLLKKMIDRNFFDERMARNDHTLAFIENDALRLDITIVCLSLVMDDQLKIVDMAIIDALKEHSLYYKQSLINNSGELLVFSTENIPEKHMTLIENEKRESSSEEADILRKYLIVRVFTRVGL